MSSTSVADTLIDRKIDQLLDVGASEAFVLGYLADRIESKGRLTRRDFVQALDAALRDHRRVVAGR